MKKDIRKYADRAEYLKEAVQRRRKSLRSKALEYKGSKCIFCGYEKCESALEFHHLDESKKEFGLSSRGLTRSWKKIKAELDKCVLVCSNCHRELHSKKLQPPVEMQE